MPNSNSDQIFALFDNPANVKIVAEIEKTGAQILKFPTIEAEKIEPDENFRGVIEHLQDYDWIVFADVLAVDFFLAKLEESGVDLYELDAARVCALGETVSDRLRFAQLHADVIPHRVDVPNVVAALENYTGESEWANLKFLVVKEFSLDGEISRALTERQAAAQELPIYQIKSAVKNEFVKLKVLLKGGAVDEFVFGAPTDFIALKRIFDEQPLAETLAEVRVSAVGGLTLQTVREHGIRRADLFRLGKIDTV